MIKLFRKIRFALMRKNETVKYLKYAIGEIILVVIRIFYYSIVKAKLRLPCLFFISEFEKNKVRLLYSLSKV